LFGLGRANAKPDFFTKDHEGPKEKGPRGTLRNANKISHKGTKEDKPTAAPKFSGVKSTQIYKDESIRLRLYALFAPFCGYPSSFAAFATFAVNLSAVYLSSLCGFVP
jgi:hypothetical protein